jgi:hypothetical protein
MNESDKKITDQGEISGDGKAVKRPASDTAYSEFERKLSEKLSEPIVAEFGEAPPGLREKILAAVTESDAGDTERRRVVAPIFGLHRMNRYAFAAVLTVAAVIAAYFSFDSGPGRYASVALHSIPVPELSEKLPGSLDSLVSDSYDKEIGRIARDIAVAEHKIASVLTAHMPVTPGRLSISVDGLDSRHWVRLPRSLFAPERRNGS